MPRKGDERRFDILLHPEVEREAAILAWIDEQRGNYSTLREFMLAVLEYAMTGESAQSTQKPSGPVVHVSIDKDAFTPIADAVGKSVGEAVKAAYADALLDSPKIDGPAAMLH